jgi:hypothetical protein
VIITVIPVAMMQLSIAEKVQMIPMRHLLMPLRLMITRTGQRHAGRGIHLAHRNRMFIVMITLRRVEMALVQIINMALVHNRHVPTLLTMNMLVV